MKLVSLIALCTVGTAWCFPEGKSYLTVISKEVDSSEHGLSFGRKFTNCSCGWTNKAKGRIVGGEETEVNEYPHMAAVMEIYPSGRAYQFCGATIVTYYHALTAAHCFTDPTTNKMAITVGEHDLSKDDETPYKQMYELSQIVSHPMYNQESNRHDIALLVTRDKIAFNNYVGPACLPHKPVQLVDQYVKVTGWGDMSYNGAASDVLRKVYLRVIPLDQCAKKFKTGQIFVTMPTQFCTFGWKKDSCQGDSGGPVTWLDPETNRYTLMGIVSYGIGCATTSPGVNTDVFTYMDWIQHNIHKTSPRQVQTCSRKD